MVYPVVERDVLSLKDEYAVLEPLVKKLSSAVSDQEREEHLDGFFRVQQFLREEKIPHFERPEYALIFKALVAIGQAKRIFSGVAEKKHSKKVLALFEDLKRVESFYAEMGGIVGYHFCILGCMMGGKGPENEEVTYHAPQGIDIGIDISSESFHVRQAVIWGLENLDKMAEIYPVGGAADRLNLKDEKTKVPLPAARLMFQGKTLLERLILDLQAREHLYFKLYGKQVETPIVMMTSHEKDNHTHILAICQEKHWFGRTRESFRFFSQPAVPSINMSGDWCLQGPLQLLLKPGGHGVIWKLARDSQTFSWLFAEKRKKALVRQINNPIAGTDYGLLAFTGYGCHEDRVFGFASCPRKAGAAEGVNVLEERNQDGKPEFILTNVEYCDLPHIRQIEKQQKNVRFSSNTNILFIDLNEVNHAIETSPFPGILINPKRVIYKRGREWIEEEVVRLESTMQNVADSFGAHRKDALRTFLTFHERKKTISSIKRQYIPGGALDETPEGCFLEFLQNGKDLLENHCRFKLIKKETSFPLLFSYHPALGPLYSIIAQKIRGGTITTSSELQLDISELDMEEISLDGSLIIEALAPLGHREKEVIRYSERRGRCRLENVLIVNRGIDWEKEQTLWKEEPERKEKCHIVIHGSGEFEAKDVVLQGSFFFEVPDSVRMTLSMREGQLHTTQEKIETPTWHWKYSVTDDFRIKLQLS